MSVSQYRATSIANFLTAYLTLFPLARRDNFGTVEPFPENIYPVGGTSAQVTCVAFDSSGMKIPERIQFVRKDTLARYTNVTATENIQLEEMRSPIDQGVFSTFESIPLILWPLPIVLSNVRVLFLSVTQ